MYQKGARGAKGAKGKGKTGKSKGKGSTYFWGECHNCGKYGHRSSDCWNEATTAKGDQTGKGKGKPFASTSTVPRSIANGFNKQQHPGKVYYSASSHQVVEKVTKVVKCAFQNGGRDDLRFKIMSPDVRRGLVSVSECVKAGNKVVFDRDHSSVYNYQNDSYKIIYLKDVAYVCVARLVSER